MLQCEAVTVEAKPTTGAIHYNSPPPQTQDHFSLILQNQFSAVQVFLHGCDVKKMFSIVVQNHVKGLKKILSYQLAAKALKESTNSANSDDPYQWIGGFLQQILCYSVSFLCLNFVPLTRFLIKAAGTSEAGSQTNEGALFPNDTFRHQKLLKIRPNHDQIKSKIAIIWLSFPIH